MSQKFEILTLGLVMVSTHNICLLKLEVVVNLHIHIQYGKLSVNCTSWRLVLSEIHLTLSVCWDE